MYQPSLEQAKEYAASGEYKQIPVCKEIFSDIRTPMNVLQALMNVSHNCYMLESVEDHQAWGRYTFLGFNPTLEITCMDGKVQLRKGTAVTQEKAEPEEIIRKILKDHKSPKIEGLPTFTGGLVGYFSYDYIKYSEPTLQLDAKDEEGFKDVDLMLFNKVIAFDNYRQKIILITNISTEDIENSYIQGISELENLAKLIQFGKIKKPKKGKMTSELKPLFEQEQYCEMVKKGKEYIREGDLFQVVLSNRLEADYEGSLLDLYRVLRTSNPSPYMFYFSSDDIEIAGASPETLVKLENGILHTFPLAGTRPRGKTKEEDEQLEQELLTDEKECAEHNMLVDLGRNDLGKVSKIGTVQVEQYMNINKFSQVMHIGSTIRGELNKKKDALDAVAAVLPAGTLSGAPKIRACEIINELEDNKRGIYGGAIGYLDFTGNMDTCIAIRLAYKKNGKIFIRSGAGIVADSIPEKEHQECINKAKAVVNAVKEAGGEHYDFIN